MLQHVWPRKLAEHPEDIATIIDEDADDVLLAILAQDSTDDVHYPTREYLARVRQRRAEHEARIQARRERNRETARRHYQRAKEQEPQWREQEKARYLAELARAERQEWIWMFQRAIGECVLDSQYRSLIPQLERDVAMIVDAPAGPLPWRLNKNVFWDTFAKLKSEIDAKG